MAFVPRGVEEPVLGLYSFSPLTPGGWVDLLGDLGLPATLRRLNQRVWVVALGAGVREPKMLRTGEVQVAGVDLSVLQPLLGAVAPDLGMAAPVVRLRDSLAPLQLRLDLPDDAAGGWPLTVTPDDPALLR